jgi:hypothetical protein
VWRFAWTGRANSAWTYASLLGPRPQQPKAACRFVLLSGGLIVWPMWQVREPLKPSRITPAGRVASGRARGPARRYAPASDIARVSRRGDARVFYRLVDTTIGCVIAVTLGYLVWPRRYRTTTDTSALQPINIVGARRAGSHSPVPK